VLLCRRGYLEATCETVSEKADHVAGKGQPTHQDERESGA
jgi:hypothetical protein